MYGLPQQAIVGCWGIFFRKTGAAVLSYAEACQKIQAVMVFQRNSENETVWIDSGSDYFAARRLLNSEASILYFFDLY